MRHGTGLDHPGGLLDEDELQVLSARFKARQEPWLSYAADLQHTTPLEYAPHAVPIVDNDYGAVGVGHEEFVKLDGQQILKQALMYICTGNEKYAQNVMTILEAWISTLQALRGHNSPFEVSYAGPSYVYAAEILKHTYSGWNWEFEYKLIDFFQKFLWPLFNKDWGNNLTSALAMLAEGRLAYAVFTEDVELFHQTIAYVRKFADSYLKPGGDNLDTCRGAAGPQYGLGALVNICEMAWKQGVDMYGDGDNRLLRSLEVHATLQMRGTCPPLEYQWTPNKQDFLPTGWEVALNHYTGRRGMPMPATSALLDAQRPTGFLYHWGYDSLTHHQLAGAVESNRAAGRSGRRQLMTAVPPPPPAVHTGWHGLLKGDGGMKGRLAQKVSKMTRHLAGISLGEQAGKAPSGAELAHPGGVMGPLEVSLLMARTRGVSVSPWKEFKAALLKQTNAEHTPKALPVMNIDYGGKGQGHNEFVEHDGAQIYRLAMAYVVTGDEKYAHAVVKILDAWACTCREGKGRNMPLEAGWGVASMAKSAELLKWTWDAWPRKVEERWLSFYHNVLQRWVEWDYKGHSGNWETSCQEAKMMVALLRDDRAEFERAAGYFQHLFDGYVLPSGEVLETKRDCVHAQFGMGGLVQMAEIAWHQGIDLYTKNTNKFIAMFELHAIILLTGGHPKIKYPLTQRGYLPAGWEMGYNHFHGRMGLELPNTKQLIAKNRPCAYVFHWGLDSLSHYDSAGRILRSYLGPQPAQATPA